MATRHVVSSWATVSANATITIPFTGTQPTLGDKIVIWLANGFNTAPNFSSGHDNAASQNSINLVSHVYPWGSVSGGYTGCMLYLDLPVSATWSGNYTLTVTLTAGNSGETWAVAIAYGGPVTGAPTTYTTNTGNGSPINSTAIAPTGTGLYVAGFLTDGGGDTIAVTASGWSDVANNGAVSQDPDVADFVEGSGSKACTWTNSFASGQFGTVLAFWPDASQSFTRFYCDSGGTAPLTSLSFAGLWDRTADAVRRPLNTSKQNSSLVTTGKQCGSVSANWDVCHYQFQSGSLPAAGTLTGTFRAWFQGIENNLAANAYPQVVVRVVSSDGSVVRGTAYSGGVQTTASAVAEFDNTSTYQAQGFPDARDSNVLTDVAYQAGDHIVVEIGVRHLTAGGTTQTATIRVGDVTANPDMVATDNNSTLSDPWIEFSQDLFGGATAKSGSDTGAGTDAISNVSLSLNEAPTIIDTPALIAFTVAESASVIDSGQSTGGKAGLDTGTGVDAISRIGLSPAEVGTGADAVTVSALQTIQPQTATAADAASRIDLSSADVAAGSDVVSLIRLTVTETVTAVDSGSVVSVGGTVSKSAAETASGADVATSIAVSSAQSASGVDSFVHNTFTTVSEQSGSKATVGQAIVGSFLVGGNIVDKVALVGLVASDSAIAIQDAAIIDLGTTTPNVSDTGAGNDQVTYITVNVSDGASAVDAISKIGLTALEASTVAESKTIGLTVTQSGSGADAVAGVSQGTTPNVAQAASVIDFARVTLLVAETGTVTENRSIPIWGPLTDAAVVGSFLLTTATPINAGHTNVVPVTAGHTSVTVVSLPTAVQVVPVLVTQVSLANNGATMLRVFRPGQLGVGAEQELMLSETAIKLIRRAELREKALAMRREQEGQEGGEGDRKKERVSSLPSLRGTGKLVRGPRR